MAPTFFLALFVMPNGVPNGVDLPAAGGYIGGQTEEDAEMPARPHGPAAGRRGAAGSPGTPPRPDAAAAEAGPQPARGEEMSILCLERPRLEKCLGRRLRKQ